MRLRQQRQTPHLALAAMTYRGRHGSKSPGEDFTLSHNWSVTPGNLLRGHRHGMNESQQPLSGAKGGDDRTRNTWLFEPPAAAAA